MRGAAVPSSALMAPMTRRFVAAVERYAERNGISIVTFRRGERKDDRTRERLRDWPGGEGVLYIGKAQEKARVVRTERRHDPATGDAYPWLADSTAMVNHYYVYAVDDALLHKWLARLPHPFTGSDRRQGIRYDISILHTETVINDTYDFAVGRRLRNLDDLKKIGFAANRRLLGVQRLSHDCTVGADVLDELHRPAVIDGQRVPALRFGDPRVQSLMAALLRFDLLPQGFRNRELRGAVASLCGLSPDDYRAGRMTYDLRRLRLRGLIKRIPRTQRYRVTAEGLCVALAYHRTQARVLGPLLSATLDGESSTRLRAAAAYDRRSTTSGGGARSRRNRRRPENRTNDEP